MREKSSQMAIELEKKYLKIIAKNIVTLRKGRLTQEELAHKSKIGRSTIGAIEQGRAISIKKMIKIAEALDVTLADLCLSEEEKTNFDRLKLYAEFTSNILNQISQMKKEISDIKNSMRKEG